MNDGKVPNEFNKNMKNGMPWVSRTAPHTFIAPFGSRRLKALPWACHMLLRYTVDAQNSPFYKDAKSIEGDHINLLADWLRINKLEEFAEQSDLTEIHEFYDLRTGEMMAYLPTGNTGKEPELDEKWLRPPTEEGIIKILGGELPFEDLCS